MNLRPPRPQQGALANVVAIDEAHSARPGIGSWRRLGHVCRNDVPPIADELAKICTRMRLPYLRKAAPDIPATARAQRWDPAEVVRVLL